MNALLHLCRRFAAVAALALPACAAAPEPGDPAGHDEPLGQVEQAELESNCAVHPSAANCTGKDPVKQGCDDASAYLTSDIQNPQTGGSGGKAVLRWSKKCKSIWTRTTVFDTGRPWLAHVEASGFAYETSGTTTSSEHTFNSPMIFIGNPPDIASYWGCGYWTGAEGGYGWSCGAQTNVVVQ